MPLGFAYIAGLLTYGSANSYFYKHDLVSAFFAGIAAVTLAARAYEETRRARRPPS